METRESKESFLDKFVWLKNEWDWEKNNKENIYPWDYTYGSNKKVNWICSKDPHHTYKQGIKRKTGIAKNECPICASKQACCENFCNTLYGTHPELRDIWVEEKNGDMRKCFPTSKKHMWWRCRVDPHHVYSQTIGSKTGYNLGCPFCANQKICCEKGCNSVYFTHPDLRNIWHWEKNGEMKTRFAGSAEMVYWYCEKNREHHVYQQSLNNKTSGNNGCPFCTNKKVCCENACNTIYRTHPKLIEQWDEKKNGDIKLYPAGSNKIVWWICPEKKHSYKQVINYKAMNIANCPLCKASGLETEFAETCKILKLNYTEQKRFDECKNKMRLPFDCCIKYKNKEILVELHGKQHFKYVRLYHPDYYSFSDRVQLDNKKSLFSNRNESSFLTISYKCANSMETILKEFLKELDGCQYLYRYYILPELFLEYKIDINLNTTISIENILKTYFKLDDILSIFHLYKKYIETLSKGKLEHVEMEECVVCKNFYVSEYIDDHYRTYRHNHNLKVMFEEYSKVYENLFWITNDGALMIEEK